MGRAKDMEKDIDLLKKELSQLKSAFNGLSATVESLQDTAPVKNHIDLHDDTRNVVAEGDKEYVDELKEEVEEAEA